MNEGNDTLNTSKRPGSEKKSDQKLSRSEKIISAGLIAAAAILWGVYGPGLMRLMGADEFLQSNKVIALLFVFCIAVSCICLAVQANWEAKELEKAMAEENKGNHEKPETANEMKESPDVEGKKQQSLPESMHYSENAKGKEILTYLACLPWLIALPPLLTVDFKWQSLLPGLWAFIAFLFACWPKIQQRERDEKDHGTPEELGRAHMYQSYWETIRSLAHENMGNKRGLSVVVTGEWGSGKSHFINSTIDELSKEYKGLFLKNTEKQTKELYSGRFKIVSVNLWQSATVEDMWQDVAGALTCALNERNSNYKNFIRKCIISILEFLKIPTPVADEALRLITGGGGENVLENIVAKRIRTSNICYMLVMDNIDRCEKKKVRALFPMVEKLSSIPKLVVLCGIATDETMSPPERNASLLNANLLKVFDYAIPIPLLAEEEAKTYRKSIIDNQDINKDSLFYYWFMHHDFSYATPRIVNKIIQQLVQVDKMFLERLFNMQHGTDDEKPDSKMCNNIFNFEAIRLVFPKLLFPFCDENRNENGAKTYNGWRLYFKNTFANINADDKEFSVKYAFQQMVNELYDANDNIIDYIATQEYTRISRLGPEQKIIFFKQYDNSKTLEEQIQNLFLFHLTKNQMRNCIKDLYGFCMMNLHRDAAQDILVKRYGEIEEIQDNPNFVLVLLSHLCDDNLSNDDIKRRRDILLHVLQKYTVKSLYVVADVILSCISDSDAWNYDYPQINGEMAYEVRKMLMMFGSYDKINETLRLPYNIILQIVLREYAKKACAFILDSPSLNDYGLYKHLMIGKSVTQEIYEDSLKEGVQEFLNSADSEPYKNNLEEGARRLLRSIIIRSHDSETLELTDMPFAVLSYAVIWSNLCHGLIKQGELMKNLRPIVGKRLAAIKTRVEKDAKMSKEEKQSKGSEQFWRNRETAMSILRTTLERLQKGASND